MTTKTAGQIRAKMTDTLNGVSDEQLIEMHAMAFELLHGCTIDESPAIIQSLSAIETQFVRRGIEICGECGCPQGKHEADFCSRAEGAQ